MNTTPQHYVVDQKMDRFLFLKDKELKAAKASRNQPAPVMDPKLLVLMSARYV